MLNCSYYPHVNIPPFYPNLFNLNLRNLQSQHSTITTKRKIPIEPLQLKSDVNINGKYIYTKYTEKYTHNFLLTVTTFYFSSCKKNKKNGDH